MGPARIDRRRLVCIAASVALHGSVGAACIFIGPVPPQADSAAAVPVEMAFLAAAGVAGPIAAPPEAEPPPPAPAPEPAPLPVAQPPAPPVVQPAPARAAPARPSPPRVSPPRLSPPPLSQPPLSQRHEAVARPPAPSHAPAVVDPAPVGAAGAPAASPAPAAGPAGPVPPAGPSAAWLRALDAWIDAHLDYPEDSRRRGEQGAVLVRLTVAHDGRLLDFALLRGSGYDELDDAARAMFRNAHLPAAPLGSDPPQATVTKPVRYVLR